jgi:hypothetical protein
VAGHDDDRGVDAPADHGRASGYDFSAPFDAGALKAPPRDPVVVPGSTSGSSPFAINKGVAIAAIVGALVLVIGGIVLMTGGSKSSNTTASGTTLPPLGAVVNNSTTTAAVTSTTSAGGLADCDSPAKFHSPDGKDYKPCGSGFSIDFPARPDVRTYDGQLSMGPIKWQVLTSTDTSQDPIVRYGVTWSNLPKEPTPEEATEAVNAVIAQLGGTAGPTTTFLGHEATTFKGVDLERPYIGVAFVVGDDVYALTVTSEAPTQKRLDELGSWFHAT